MARKKKPDRRKGSRAGQTTGRSKKRTEAVAAEGPTPGSKAALGGLSQAFDVWQADCRQAPIWVEGPAGMLRPWLTLVLSSSDGLVLAHELSEERPDAASLWDALATAMQGPLTGAPHRPTQVQLRPGPVADALQTPLEEIGVGCLVTEDLDQLELAFAGLSQHLAGDREPGLLDVEGVTPEQTGRVFEAAAAFYERAPWRRLDYEAVIRIECTGVAGGPWYGVVFGLTGTAYGLALYDDLAALRALQDGMGSDEDNARATVGTTVNYGEAWEIPVGDLDAAARYGWKVAGPRAHPHVFRKERGMNNLHPPSPEELNLVEACLRTVPAFVHEHDHHPNAAVEQTVRVAKGEVAVRLSWVGEDEG